jgi:hypothetical protein
MYDQILTRSSGGRRGKQVKVPAGAEGTESVGTIRVEAVDWFKPIGLKLLNGLEEPYRSPAFDKQKGSDCFVLALEHRPTKQFQAEYTFFSLHLSVSKRQFSPVQSK